VKNKQSTFQIGTTRQNVIVTFEDGQTIQGKKHVTLETLLNFAIENQIIRASSTLIGAICDGKLRELSHELESDATIQPIWLSDSDGGRIYRRSLVLLLTTAVMELFGHITVKVNHAVPEGGFFCLIEGREPLNADEIGQLLAKMREIVEENHPITKTVVSLDEAKTLFNQRNEYDKVRLLDVRDKDTLTLYSLKERSEYYYGYMVPSTSYLDTFDIIPVDDGFILHYPRGENQTLKPIARDTKLVSVFRESDKWLDRLEVEDIGRLNHLVSSQKMREIILVAEALHEQRVARIATRIRDEHDTGGAQVILIAGPSSSGKTTFSKRLAIQLLAHGLKPFTLEMDNYFVDREKTPRDIDGNYDFESLHALDLPRLNHDLAHLIAGEEVQLPRFDFKQGKSLVGKKAQIAPNQIIIIEGIHGLNPNLVTEIDKNSIFRVYVSALTQLNIDNHNRIPTTDVRLLRRIIRDAKHRGWTATDTLLQWRSVRRGEKRNIFPYQENADVMFNSALVYELAALKLHVEPLLLQVQPFTPAHVEANRLLSFLKWVQPLALDQMNLIPDTSLLREFIGGSILDDYHPLMH